MSSVQDFEDCPRCGKMGVSDFNCRSHEKWFQCLHCGLTQEIKTLIDRKKSTKERQYYKFNKKGGFIQRLFITRAFGAYYIEGRSGRAQFGGLTEDPLDEKVISRFRNVLENPDVDATRSYLTRWDDESKKVIFLIGAPEIALRICGGDRETSGAEHIENPELGDDTRGELPF